MNELVDLGLFTKGEKVLVSSRIIARAFEKEHKEIIYIIEGRISKGKTRNKGLYKQLLEIGGEHHASNYMIRSQYADTQNRKQTEYLLTRDGFSLVAMYIKGEKALKWKLKYIEAFNKMEAFIREKLSSEWKETRIKGKLCRRNETDVIMTKLIPLAVSQGSKNAGKLYMTYSKLVNK
ncbi:Rha family transcriptional regulator [Clostridium coskatii]|uniref:Phage regulatory protein Rha n=1 Tax=Clostridium coskatii TaxID=1705578 RepID=A0A162J790_9CLOT|nr:Rha family transcriptional regulator [Clostridium coskatii]OAA91325.1 Phage regulatory protein Rha (Phage_pRha) [Clostridium coskatii]OBR93957.1 phage regulatory protein Rha [Clostridium coskatii]